MFRTIIFLCLVSCAHSEKCADFRTGEFKYTNPGMSGTTIFRSDSVQIEKDNVNGTETHTTIEWVSSCEYILTYVKLLNYEFDTDGIIGSKIRVEIIETDGKRYKCRVKSSVTNEELEFKKVN